MNTAQDRLEKTVLPAHEIEVFAGCGTTGNVAGEARESAENSAAPTTIAYPGSELNPDTSFWRALALLNGVLWLITLAMLWKSRRRRTARDAATSVSAAPGRSDFLRACALGDLAGAERALVSWGRSERPGIRNLGELIAALADENQRTVLDDLLRMRYAGADPEGMGARLTRAFRPGLQWKDAPSKPTPPAALPALYPGDR